MIAVQPLPTGPPTAITWLNQACSWDFRAFSPGDKRIHFKTFRSALIAWMLQARLPEFDNSLGFMAYGKAVLTGVPFQAAFQGEHVLPAPVAPIFPAAPTTANVAAHAAAQKVYSAYVACHQDLKSALEYYFSTNITHLRHELTQYHTVTAMQMWEAAVASYGTPQSEDIDKLRAFTLLPCDRSITAEENIVQYLARHKTLLDQGAEYATNSGQKLLDATKILSSMAPATKAIVEKYYADTDFQARTVDALLTAVQDGLRRLPAQPDLSAIRSEYNVVQQCWEFHEALVPTAYAATADTSIPSALALQAGGGKKRNKKADEMSLEELRSFYKACTVGHYCFLHGWGNHAGEKNAACAKSCHIMNSDAKYTPAMKALKKPQYRNGALQAVDGLMPSTTLQPGFRYPN